MRRSTLKLSVLGLGLASAAWSIPVTLADTTTKLDVGVMLQTRAEHNWAENDKGADFDVNRGSLGTSDPIDFYGRRARLTVAAEREGWKGLVTFAADNTDPAGKKSRSPELLYLWAEKSIKSGSFTHILHAGLDQPNVQPAYRTSSGMLLFPTTRATATLPSPTSAYGLRYQVNHSQFQFSADVQNNRAPVRADNSESEGLFYATRAVASLLPGVAVPKLTETFVGEKGKALTLGLDGTLDHAYVQKSGTTVFTSSYGTLGADVVFHMDGLTAIADGRVQTYFVPETVGDDATGYAVALQAGYAIPVPAVGIVVEPALRGSVIDNNIDDEAIVSTYASKAGAEHGGSGYEGEVGVNIYFNGHKNKIQLAYQRWESENSDANANIVRLQHQFQF
jgi:hypothetical protein